MSQRPDTPLLDQIVSPADLRTRPVAELIQIAKELRAETISAVSETGGHLGAGLGVIELTVALHAVFNTPEDHLIWDVGHQCYPHKILTGRRDRIRTLRQEGGLSGFTKRSESVYDPFGAGHSSTSISAALGFAVAAGLNIDAKSTLNDAVAVIGDGAFTAGMVFEAMNHAGGLGQRMFVVLNDNDMSIAPPVGALAKTLSSIYRGPFSDVKTLAKGALEFFPSPMREGAKRAHDLVKNATMGGGLFEELGFHYFGPIDGHDVEELVETFRFMKERADGPVLIHVKTEKGKGYAPAENSGDRYHGVSQFDVSTGVQSSSKKNAPSYTKIFAQALIECAQDDERIVAVTAAMPDGTGLNLFRNLYPERMFDVGIAEQHAVTFSAGLAAAGMRPFCTIYSTFLQRGYDQIIHDVAVQKLPVRFAIDRAGLVGADGATHAGSFDIAYLSNLPYFVVMAPADENELAHMVRTAAHYDEGPIAFRYPRGQVVGLDSIKPEILEIGKSRTLHEGQDVTIISYGSIMQEVEEARLALAEDGICPTIIDARFAKPLDAPRFLEVAQSHDIIITIEEGAAGGFGNRVAELYAQAGVFDKGLKFRMLTLVDQFIDHAAQDAMRKIGGIDKTAIINTIKKLL